MFTIAWKRVHVAVEAVFTITWKQRSRSRGIRIRNRILNGYPRHKLTSDATRFGAPGRDYAKIAKAEAIAWFRQMEEIGLVEGFDQFRNDLVVERNASDPNRLDFLLPPDLINQFIVGAVKLQFRP